MSENKEELLQQFLSTLFKVRRFLERPVSVPGEAATMLQLQALSLLNEKPGSTVGELAQELRMSSPAIAQLTDRLVGAQLIERKNDKDDRRVVRLFLTKTGKEDLQKVSPLLKQRLGKVFSQVPEGDLKELVRIFTNILNNIESQKE